MVERRESLSLADFELMASWNANVVRVALFQDFWLAASPLFDPNYAGMVDTAIAWAEAEGMDVILDLHWSDAGVFGSCLPSESRCQQEMPDTNSITFWSEVATRYKQRRARDLRALQRAARRELERLEVRRRDRATASRAWACSSSTTPCARPAPRTW